MAPTRATSAAPWQVPVTLMYLAILVEITISIRDNIRQLGGQVERLRSLGIDDPTATPVYLKWRMYQHLAVAVFLYASLELVIHSTFSNRHDESLHWFIGCHQARTPIHPLVLLLLPTLVPPTRSYPPIHLSTRSQAMELLVASLIGYHFRARPFPVAPREAEQLAASLVDTMLPSMTVIGHSRAMEPQTLGSCPRRRRSGPAPDEPWPFAALPPTH